MQKLLSKTLQLGGQPVYDPPLKGSEWLANCLDSSLMQVAL